MAWYNFNNTTFNPFIYVNKTAVKLMEGFKGKVLSDKIKFPQKLGVEHPFSFEAVEGVYKKVPIIMGAVDKYVDFIVGPGFSVKSDNEEALKEINDFILKFNFDSVLRDWIKEGLVKGNGYLELGDDETGVITGLKVLDSKYIYIDTDEKGKITKYNQYFKDLRKIIPEEINSLPVDDIAHIPINKIGDNPYGFGIVSSALITVDNLLQNQKDLHTLMNRKANSPMHVKVGDVERNLLPTEEDINAIGKKLEYMTNKLEWATDPTWDIKVVDFGDIGEKFSFVLEYDVKMLLYGLQVPEVLMGSGNIPEGLAKVQMDAWERNIQSKQAEIEHIIEERIFQRVLKAKGITAHVEIEWGKQSKEERATDIRLITELLRIPELNFGLKYSLQQKIADMYVIKESELSSKEEEKRDNLQKQLKPKPKGDKMNIKDALSQPTIGITKIPECATKGCDNDAFILLHGNFVCGECVIKYQNYKSKMVNALLNNINDNAGDIVDSEDVETRK